MTFATFLIFFGILTSALVSAQFPNECQANLTSTIPAVCCPAPEDSPLVACGGPGRGICTALNPTIDDLDMLDVDARFLQDDRFAWPTRFFSWTCVCQGNWAGVDCGQCKPGWTGERCQVRRPPKMRRNVLTLTPAEQRAFRDRVNLAKQASYNWTLLNISTSRNADPITVQKLSMVQAPSVYDFFVFIHLYAARSTLVNDRSDQNCDPNEQKLDFAHKGPGFLTWHRAFMLRFEEELARVGTRDSADPIARRDGDDFALPYWDWTANQGCPVCTNELVGAIANVTQPVAATNLDPVSPFANWSTFCPQRPQANDCHICDPGVNWEDAPDHPLAGGPLWRNRMDDSLAPNLQQLPDQASMDACFTATDYDVWPYRNGAGRRSFRDMVEGFTDPLGRFPSPPVSTTTTTTASPPPVTEAETTVMSASSTVAANVSAATTAPPDIYAQPVFMHNLVHSYMNGSWFDVATSPNDPIFLLHHAFVDKIFELWLRKNLPGPSQYPRRGCPPGHAAHSNLVPLFPPVENIDFFTDSRNLGYDYDTYLVGETLVLEDTRQATSLARTDAEALATKESMVLTGVLTAIGVLLAVGITFGVAALRHRLAKNKPYTFKPAQQATSGIGGSATSASRNAKRSEKTPLLAEIS